MGFRRGDPVEVSSKEDGFEGSYFSATIISELLKKEYIIQYNTLLMEDMSGPLREIVSISELRPVPPPVPTTGFRLFDKVDAYDNDGWWVGTISGRIGSKYFVYFETSGDEIAYSMSQLRLHQDLMDGKWVWSTNNSASN